MTLRVARTRRRRLRPRARAIESQGLGAIRCRHSRPRRSSRPTCKRLQLTDCGTIRFDVADPQKFLIYFGSVERARRYNGIAITSLLRRLLGSKTSTQIIEQAESVAQEIRQLIDLDVEHAGISVRDINARSASVCDTAVIWRAFAISVRVGRRRVPGECSERSCASGRADPGPERRTSRSAPFGTRSPRWPWVPALARIARRRRA